MTVGLGTKVHELLESHPYLKEWLADYAPEFEKLKNPVLYRTVGRVATLEAAAAMAGVAPERFLDDVRTEIAKRAIAAEEAGAPAVPEEAPERADRAERQEALKAIIRRLHDGASVEDVKADFDALVAEVDPAEIAAMEQALIAEGMPVEEVQRLCDVHVSVFKDALESEEEPPVPAGHPIEAYRRENQAAAEILYAVRCALDALGADDAAAREAAVRDLAAELGRLSDIAIHYTRKENQLFPALERHGIEGPTKVMWGLDDGIRERLAAARRMAEASDAAGLSANLPETLRMVEDMIYKEEKILFPTALEAIAADEWAEMAAGDAEIGYAWIEVPPEAAGAAHGVASSTQGAAAEATGTSIPLPTGALSADQLDALFRRLPFDLTFVDEDDRVRFYTEGERVFPRSPAVVGREVRNCHPPKSVDKVERILEAFKAGKEDVAEFWIELGGRFVHIRYLALRDAYGAYRGCLEVVQDATRVRSLEGERRLLDW